MSASSRLSSLLVRDGLVGVKRMEQAFQRQVIYGGALDTILLEMGAVSEDRLLEYLSLASGLPPADRDLYDYFDPRAVQVCPRELAEEFHVAPIAFDGEALRVLVSDPVDLGQLEALATRLGAPIQPFVVPEFRMNLIVERLFGLPTASRYASLAAKQAAARRPQPPEPKVIVEDVDIRRVTEKPNMRTRTGPMSTDTVARALERTEQQRRHLAGGAAPPAPPVPAAPPPPAPLIAPSPQPVVETNVPQVVRTPQGTSIVRTPVTPKLDPTPLEARAAVEQLRQAAGRDDVFRALIRGVRARTRYAASLVVQGEMAFGREALGEAGVDAEVTQVALPVTALPAFRTAVASGSPYIGPVGSSDPPALAALKRLGGVVPPTALLLPVVIKTRVVALVYAHRMSEPLSVPEAADVLPLASEAALALTQLIVKAKSAGYGRAPETPVPPPIADVPSKPRRRSPDSGRWKRAVGPAVAPPNLALGDDTPRPASLGPLRAATPIASLLDLIEAGGTAAAAAVDEAVARVDETVPALRRRLPGKLWVDRYASARPTRASQHGPLLALLVRLGDRAAPLLVELLGSEDREARYYATLAGAEVRTRELVHPLVARLYDADHGVRAAAIDALAGYPPQSITHALEPVRQAVHGEPARARAAAHALGELRDLDAIPDLIAATERDHTTAEEARRALVQLTKQDFGSKAKKWRAWWEKNHERPRIEWMLDGLAHADDHVRHSASEELKRVTGEYFGYHYDLPKREREEARAKWLKWWDEVGKRRFTGTRRDGIPEAERPTAMLPANPTGRRGT
jgi:hypothetical protein